MYHLDTNSLIYFFKGMGQLGSNLRKTSRRRVAISSVVLYELEVGIAKSRSSNRRQQLARFIESVTVLPFGPGEATVGGELRAQLELQGKPMGPLDNLIAATALCHDATLVTRNTKEFSRVSGLRIENWFD